MTYSGIQVMVIALDLALSQFEVRMLGSSGINTTEEKCRE